MHQPPNIDIGGKIKVIDDTVIPPRWKTICTIPVASRKVAIDTARQHLLQSFWLFDDLGNREFVHVV